MRSRCSSGWPIRSGIDGVAINSAQSNPSGALSLITLMQKPQRFARLSLREWDMVLRLARAANLLGRVARTITQAGLAADLPALVQRHLTSVQRLTDHQQQAIRWECAHLALALAPLGIPVILLKGAAYAMAGHDAGRGRLFGDVDLLVPQASLNAVEAALMLHGWSTGPVDPYDQRYYRRWMHELPPMTNIKRGTVVDVHHNILPLSSGQAPDAAALLAASIGIEGSVFRTLSPLDMVIHSATHLFHEGQLKNGLRDLYDLDALLGSLAANDPGCWPKLLARARELKLVWPVFLALRYTQRLLDTAVPPAAMAEAAGAAALRPWRLALFDAIYLRAFAPDHALLASPAIRLARSALYLRGHALRMPAWRLALHLGRKAWLRLFKHTSRAV